MKASDQGDEMLGPPLQRYFCEYLINQRQLSPCTIAAYRDTFRLLLGFLEQRQGIKPEGLRLRDLDADRVLAFLDDLERTRRNCARSRNARLAAIRSFVRFAAASNPLLLPIAQRVLAIPSKRFERGVVRHLASRQVQALLDAPDGSTWTGLRDRVLLTLMYNTGARVSELAALKVGDLRLENGGSGSVHLRGKGRKQRAVPLWRESLRLVRSWLDKIGAPPDAPLLPNGRGGHLSRSGIEHRLRLAARRAAVADPALGPFQVSPHTIRHYAERRIMPTASWVRRELPSMSGARALLPDAA